jgi:hypothetical protein
MYQLHAERNGALTLANAGWWRVPANLHEIVMGNRPFVTWA